MADPAIQYLNEQAESSQRVIRQALRRFVRFTSAGTTSDFEGYPWSEVDTELLQQYRQFLIDQKLSESTRNLYIIALRGVIRQAARASASYAPHQRVTGELLSALLEVKVSRPNSVDVGREVSEEEQSALINSIKGDFSASKRDKALIILMLRTGIRVSELVSIAWRRSDLTNNEQRTHTSSIEKDAGSGAHNLIVQGKGKKLRRIPLHQSVVPYLNEWLEARGNKPGPLFTRISKSDIPSDIGITTEGVRYILRQRLLKAADITKITPHDLRRTFATNVLRKTNGDILLAQQLLGHEDPKTTERYNKRQLDDARNSLNEIFKDVDDVDNH